MPPWIFAIELGVVALYIAAALDARFAIDYGDSLYADVVCAKERTLTTESLVFYLFHFLFSKSFAKYFFKIYFLEYQSIYMRIFQLALSPSPLISNKVTSFRKNDNHILALFL